MKVVAKRAAPKRDTITVSAQQTHEDILVYIDGNAVVNLRAINGQLHVRMMGAAAIQPIASNMFVLEFK
jgi:hypothetical protein